MTKPNFWTPNQGNNIIRILPAYPKTEEDFFLENREHGWVLMNILTWQEYHNSNYIIGIKVWKTDVDVLYHILDRMLDPLIGDITHLETGRVINAYQSLAVIRIYPKGEKEPLPKRILENIGSLPNLKEVDEYLSDQLERKLNKYRRIDLG